ncbi:MAG: PorT family protein, partial [Flavobacteriaceae bacterium]
MSGIRLLIVLGVFGVLSIKAQSPTTDSTALDSLYLEDQFYLATQIGVITAQSAPVINQNLSYGFRAGFIKDIPLNSKRTFGVGW